jgi:hypothetical protein
MFLFFLLGVVILFTTIIVLIVQKEDDSVDMENVIQDIALKLKEERVNYIKDAIDTLKQFNVYSGEFLTNDEDIKKEARIALKAFQTISVIGFVFRHYVSYEESSDFEKKFLEEMNKEDVDRFDDYDKRYLNCKGNITRLSFMLASDISQIYNIPKTANDITIGRILTHLQNRAKLLSLHSQLSVAASLGDNKMAKKLTKAFKENEIRDSNKSIEEEMLEICGLR